ncbi:MAG: hypothetical protein HZB39_10440 [Planctomycetes bacterium]|nr:hypothetical protein [Planctomycetota bacterium]
MTIIRFLAAALLCAGVTFPQHEHAPAAKAEAKTEAQVQKAYTRLAAYPLDVCIASDKKLGDDAVTFEAGGRTFKTCCEKCQAKIEKDPAPFVEKLDAAVATAVTAAQLPQYPLDVCPLPGKKLGSMGDPIQLVLDGTLVQLCCKGCIKRANAGAAGIVERIHDAAYAAQAKAYPLKDCVISDHELGADAVSVMVGTKLVRLCCKDCIEDVSKDPAAAVAKVVGAAAPKTDAEAAPKKDGAHGQGHEKHGKDGEPAAQVELTATKGKKAEDCGDACVEKAAGGCCKDGAKAAQKPVSTKPVSKEQGADCCETTTTKTATPMAGGCCDGAKGATPVTPPAKKD